MLIKITLFSHFILRYLVCVGEGKYVGGRSQPMLSSVLSAVKEENQYKGKGKKAGSMSRCTIV